MTENTALVTGTVVLVAVFYTIYKITEKERAEYNARQREFENLCRRFVFAVEKTAENLSTVKDKK